MARTSSSSTTDECRPLKHTVVETHPESIVDLRLSHPFPALVAHAATYNYATMDSEQHTHVPAVVILVKALEEWKAAVRHLSLSLRPPLAPQRLTRPEQHDGRTPTGSAERKDFMDGVVKQKRHADEDNFDEAVTLFRRAGTRPGVRLAFFFPLSGDFVLSFCVCSADGATGRATDPVRDSGAV